MGVRPFCEKLGAGGLLAQPFRFLTPTRQCRSVVEADSQNTTSPVRRKDRPVNGRVIRRYLLRHHPTHGESIAELLLQGFPSGFRLQSWPGDIPGWIKPSPSFYQCPNPNWPDGTVTVCVDEARVAKEREFELMRALQAVVEVLLIKPAGLEPPVRRAASPDDPGNADILSPGDERLHALLWRPLGFAILASKLDDAIASAQEAASEAATPAPTQSAMEPPVSSIGAGSDGSHSSDRGLGIMSRAWSSPSEAAHWLAERGTQHVPSQQQMVEPPPIQKSEKPGRAAAEQHRTVHHTHKLWPCADAEFSRIDNLPRHQRIKDGLRTKVDLRTHMLGVLGAKAKELGVKPLPRSTVHRWVEEKSPKGMPKK